MINKLYLLYRAIFMLNEHLQGGLSWVSYCVMLACSAYLARMIILSEFVSRRSEISPFQSDLCLNYYLFDRFRMITSSLLRSDGLFFNRCYSLKSLKYLRILVTVSSGGLGLGRGRYSIPNSFESLALKLFSTNLRRQYIFSSITVKVKF